MSANPSPPESFNAPDVAGIEELLTTFLDVDHPHLTPGEITDGVRALDRLRCLADAALTAAVGHLDAGGAYTYDGAASAAVWLRTRSELSPGHASELVHRSRDLRSTPHVERAHGDGILGTAKVRMLLAARQGYEDLFADDEGGLVAEIRNLTVDQARSFINRWRATAEAAKAHEQDDELLPDPEDENEAHLSMFFQGRFRLDAEWDPITGQSIENAVNAEIDELFRTGTAFSSDGIKRSRRVADAIAALILRGAEPGLKQGQPRPSVTLNIDLGSLLRLPVGSPAELLARSFGLTNGTPISASAADRLLCSADVTALFTRLGLNGIVEPLGAVHFNRYPTATERRALALRDQGCVFPGCDAPVDRSDAHHLDHWNLHGRTELGRLVMLCRYHHHCVHEGGYALDRSPTGVISVTRPDGTVLADPSPAEVELFQDTGPPGDAEKGPPPRTASRFRTMAERRDAEQRESDWWQAQTRPRIDALITEATRHRQDPAA